MRPVEVVVRIVFLDFDGVIATSGTYKRARTVIVSNPDGSSDVQWPNPVELIAAPLVANVSTLCLRVEAGIILTTSWRHEFSLSKLEEFLRTAGLDARVPVIDTTPTPGLGHRGKEIAVAVAKYGLETRDILILEDRQDVTPFRGRLVKTSFQGFKQGFTVKHLAHGIRKFGLRA